MIVRSIAILGFAYLATFLIRYDISPLSREGVLLLIFSVPLLLGALWRRLGESKAYGGLLLCLSPCLLFFASLLRGKPDVVFLVGFAVMAALQLRILYLDRRERGEKVH